MRIAGLLATLPVLATAVPTIIPIAVDQNLSESTLDLSPDHLDSAASEDWLSTSDISEGPDTLTSAQSVQPPHVEAPKSKPGLSSPQSKGDIGATPVLAVPEAKQACGLPQHQACPGGQICARHGNDPKQAGVCRQSRPAGPATNKNDLALKASTSGLKGADADLFSAIAAAALERERGQRRR